ncbi:dehydrodolichyl diphosphate synthase complex subunit NUS1-like [Triticum urartu]|uniref:dehydrodolichyl diphosphate synthase complex subunit NUS1-like n=1 Tax=Triticum urartu TaxID=4572 RepID=UPI002043D433|nr:dehydrodolichyl diphosphate synthase complex subunit NUS1-like [Triticum urartu]
MSSSSRNSSSHKPLEAFVANETPIIVNKPPPHVFKLMSLPSMIIKLTLGLLWCIIHLAISLLSLCSHLIFNLECCLISSGLLWKYRNLQLGKLKYLAIVVDSREAKNTVKINQLLYWLKTLGVKYVCLYDIDGVLKKLFEPGMNGSRDNNPGDYLDVSANIKALDCCQKQMTIECISGSDGKEGIAKAANLLCSTYLNGDSHTQEDVKSEVNVKNEPVFTETDMASALKSIGCAGPEPDLLLVYGPARCHLGFPTWRLRYTEIMHMGPLKSMKYGAIVKAFHNYSKKHQNYGK